MSKKLRILYHLPSIETVYAQRTIYQGYKDAFKDLGYEFFTLTSIDNLKETLEKINPHIFMTFSHNYYLKFLDLQLLMEYRKKTGMVMFTKIDFWNSPMKWYRINEAKSLKYEKEKIKMIKNGLLGDIFHHNVEQNDLRMNGFTEATQKKFVTILLAANKKLIFPDYDEKFKADISYIGTNLPQKRKAFKEKLFPLSKKYDLKLYGQDWTLKDKLLGLIQKFGQYFNISFLKTIQKPKLKLEDERKIYSSSKICVNIHEDYQIKHGKDMNERVFKIPLCKGFQITDYVSCMDKYFNSDEIVYAKTKEEWFKKIDYYMKNPEKRKRISENGYKKILNEHTYHNRVKQIIKLYDEFIGK
ncbi:MAG: glycosyltransferase [Nanoarchaeota archaeon]